MMSKRVGVIGGGQLAWMMAGAAEKLGIELVIQTPSAADPAVAIAHHTLFAAIDDAAATARLAEDCDVITFENEFVNLDALSRLAAQGVRFYPQLEAIAPLLDKYHQRCYLQDLGLPVPQFWQLTTTPHAPLPTSYPFVLKACRHGYDGQGTFIIQNQTALAAVFQQQSGASWLLEEFIPFERELAVMAARSVTGEIVVYPVVETQQENQVCRRVLVTHDLDPIVVERVRAIAHKLLESLNFVGIMGIEFFLTQDGNVVVNETAPRTHNSGHYTLDACITSQFEQHLRAVCSLPLGNPAMHSPNRHGHGAVMVNLLGYEHIESDYLAQRQQLTQIPNAHVYWYGKTQSRPGRKLGHVTVLLDTLTDAQGDLRQQALTSAEVIESIWYPHP
jgi:5-(carboxyamino)imidazole ribonucleotide synthase